MSRIDSPSYAVTGVDSFWGLELAARLVGRSGGAKVLGLDLSRPAALDSRVDFEFLDLTNARADDVLAGFLEAHGVDVLVHLAFKQSPGSQHEYDRELEVDGSARVLRACAAAGLSRFVMASTTMGYGPGPENPNYLAESRTLAGHPRAHCVQNRVEVEHAVQAWSQSHSETQVTVLRHCWPMGPRYRNYVHHALEAPVVTTCLGYDPLLQFIHEEDLLNVYEEAAIAAHPGTFNVVGRGAMPLSRLLSVAGKRRLPLPARLLDRAVDLGLSPDFGDEPSGFYDYLRYLWVADGGRGWAEFGEPVYSTSEAWLAFVAASREARQD